MGKFERFGRFVDRCESPIERRFLVALLFCDSYTFEPFEHPPAIARDSMGVELGQQVSVGDYRVDFTLTRPGSARRFAIELDGFAYHGSTPEQFELDAGRQRALTAAGWTVIRFSGRELVRNAPACAEEAMRAASTLVPHEDTPSVPTAILSKTTDPVIVEIQRAMDGADWDEQLRLAAKVAERVRSRHCLTTAKEGTK